MDTVRDVSLAGVEPVMMHHFTQQAYLDYAMYVILDRALPSVADGLKPVQRRIVYAMSELGLSHVNKFKKSARTVGDVLGKFHPHGDVACYEAMVLMAQPFSYRYPLVDGQGNWGSTDDPKSFAAMRYTEARLSPYAKLLLDELDQGTVSWQPNFDGTLKEPQCLPAKVPNVLLNSCTGIAVGMSTDIPPHHMGEVIDACLHVLKHPNATAEDLFEHIQGPDFPTGAELITPKKELLKMYEQGTGGIRLRATYMMEDGEIVITALPYQVSGGRILEQIASQMQAKKLPMVVDLRDESDHEHPTRLVITPRSNRVDIEGLMRHLFSTTDLEKTYRVNLNMIGLDGRPQVKSLTMIISEWLHFRTETIRRRLQHRYERVEDRLAVLAGLLIAYLNIDEVIRIIREEDDPKAELMAQFGLTDRQAEAILNLKLRYLAKLEEEKIRAEENDLSRERDELRHLLDSDRALKGLLAKELRVIKKQFEQPRRTAIVERAPAQAMSAVDMVPVEPVTVVVSKLGWVRCAKGSDVDGKSLSYKSGDRFLVSCHGRSNHQVIFIDSQGRSYSQLAVNLPSARGQGEPLTGRFTVDKGITFDQVLMGSATDRILVGSHAGFGFVTRIEDMISKNKAGKALISLSGGRVLPPLMVQYAEQERLVLVSEQGRMLVFPLMDLPALAKGKGNMLMKLEKQAVTSGSDGIAAWIVVDPGESIFIHAGKHYKRFAYEELEPFIGTRGRRGILLPKGYRRVTEITKAT